ncbi:ATP synthase F1 subunit epsilon [Aphelenchoides bicaudatus]|nr:ATP synthase F1 subunit epsilon [Aphelenchoides bicaudatus]
MSLVNRCFVRGLSISSRVMFAGDGSGAGKGGGSGGSIRDAGGSFGKMEQAREEEYFHRLQRAQLKSMREQLNREIEHHENQTSRHKKRLQELEREEASLIKE